MTTVYRVAQSTNRELPACDHRGITDTSGNWHPAKVIPSNLGDVHECKFINGALNPLGWKVAVDASTCRKCAEPLQVKNRKTHLSTELVDAVTEQILYFLIAPVANALPEDELKRYCGVTRVEAIKKCLEMGVPRETILEKLKEAFEQRGFSGKEALRVADESGLFDENPREA